MAFSKESRDENIFSMEIDSVWFMMLWGKKQEIFCPYRGLRLSVGVPDFRVR